MGFVDRTTFAATRQQGPAGAEHDGARRRGAESFRGVGVKGRCTERVARYFDSRHADCACQVEQTAVIANETRTGSDGRRSRFEFHIAGEIQQATGLAARCDMARVATIVLTADEYESDVRTREKHPRYLREALDRPLAATEVCARRHRDPACAVVGLGSRDRGRDLGSRCGRHPELHTARVGRHQREPGQQFQRPYRFMLDVSVDHRIREQGVQAQHPNTFLVKNLARKTDGDWRAATPGDEWCEEVFTPSG